MAGKSQPPPVLYHYTRIESFRSILESGKIRATRYDQMNDESELRIGVQRLIEAVEGYQPKLDFRQYKQFLQSAIHGFNEKGLEVYILSLSETADSLEQWRAYAPHGGVAIGFDSQKVQKGFLCDITRRVGGQHVENPIRPDPANRLIRCTYTDRQGQLDLHQIVANRFMKNSYPSLFAKRESSAQQIFQSLLSVAIYQTICCIKHGAYAQEQEWRCVNFEPDPKDYPVKLSETNKRYIEMKFDPKEYIKEVWISPHGDRQACERVISYFTKRDELPLVIRNSTIPFRG